MSIFRRLTAILLQCVVVATPLSSGFIRCDDSGHSAHMEMADMSMTDMSMPGMPMPGDSDGGSSDSHSDCSLPWSSGECQSMTSCAPSAMRVEPATVIASVVTDHEGPVLKTDGLRSVIRAPEPPPPRA